MNVLKQEKRKNEEGEMIEEKRKKRELGVRKKRCKKEWEENRSEK